VAYLGRWFNGLVIAKRDDLGADLRALRGGLEQAGDGDGRPGKRGDLWPLSVVACGGVRSGIGTKRNYPGIHNNFRS
jgi:hypothetical protein